MKNGKGTSAWNGTGITSTTAGANTDLTTSLGVLQASDGANLGTFSINNSPEAIGFDGENIWVAHGLGTTRLQPSDGTNLGTVNFANGRSVASPGRRSDTRSPPL